VRREDYHGTTRNQRCKIALIKRVRFNAWEHTKKHSSVKHSWISPFPLFLSFSRFNIKQCWADRFSRSNRASSFSGWYQTDLKVWFTNASPREINANYALHLPTQAFRASIIIWYVYSTGTKQVYAFLAKRSKFIYNSVRICGCMYERGTSLWIHHFGEEMYREDIKKLLLAAPYWQVREFSVAGALWNRRDASRCADTATIIQNFRSGEHSIPLRLTER